MLAVLGTLLLSTLFASAARAQCATVHGSGCPHATSAPHCVTPPQIGTVFSVQCPACAHDRRSFVVVGAPLHSPIVIGAPVTCHHQLCNLSCSPLALLFANHVQIHIPNDHHLIGLSLCIQCGCVDPTVPCLELSLATRATITS